MRVCQLETLFLLKLPFSHNCLHPAFNKNFLWTFISHKMYLFYFLRTRARGTTRPMDWKRGRLVVLFLQFPLLWRRSSLLPSFGIVRGTRGLFICFRLSLSLSWERERGQKSAALFAISRRIGRILVFGCIISEECCKKQCNFTFNLRTYLYSRFDHDG